MKGNAKKVYRFLSGLLVTSVVIAVIIFVLGWVFVFKLSTDMGRVKTESAYLKKEVIALENLKKNYKTISESEGLVFDSIPKEKSVSSFMADMETLAAANSLKITESVIGFGKDGSKLKDQSLSQMVKTGNYYQLNIKFSVEGSYVNFTKFIEKISSMRRVTGISTINLFRTTEAVMQKKDTVRAGFVTSVYVMK